MATPSTDPNLLLLQKFAPVLYLHPQESNFPSSVDWYLQCVSLLDENGNQVSSFNNDAASLADQSLNQRINWMLNIINPSSTQAGDQANFPNIPCYGYVRPVLDSNGKQVATDLTYWFFYPYNGNIFDTIALAVYIGGPAAVNIGPIIFVPVIGPIYGLVSTAVTAAGIVPLIKSAHGLGKHEGDWETATVRLTADQTAIAQLFTSAHASGAWTTTYDTTPDGRPIIYVAQYSHANYTTQGTITRLAGCANDHTASSSYMWDTKNTVVNVGWNPHALQLISWKQCTPPPFPPPWQGANPPQITSVGAVLDNSGNVVYCGTSPSGKQYQYYYLLQGFSLDPENNPSLGWTIPYVVDPRYASPFPLGGDSIPALASNNMGIFVTAIVSGTDIMWSVASISPLGGGVSFWNGNGRSLADNFTTPQSINASANPAIAINDNNYVLLAYKNTSGSYTYWGGSISTAQSIFGGTQAIDWWNQPIANNDTGDSSPSIALNAEGVVVSVRSSKGSVYYSIGMLNTANNTINWNQSNVSYGKGNNPRVAINKDGTVIETHVTKNTIYYHIGEIAENNGQRSIEWSNNGSSFNGGEGTSFGKTTDNPSIALIDGLLPPASSTNSADNTTSMQDNERPVVVLQAAKDGWQVGIEGIDNFDNWQPNNGAVWLKYSGHWGNKATDPIIDLAGQSLAEVEPGPTGPAYKNTWLTGPTD